MKRVKLKVEAREDLGRGPARRLRVAGKIPAVVYGTSGSYRLTVDQAEFRMLTRDVGDSAAIIELDKGSGAELLTVIQEVQHDALKDRVNHIDFLEVNKGVEMTAHVPIHVLNEDKCSGVKNQGGMVEVNIHSVDVRTLPMKLPEYLEVDAIDLKVGDSIRLGQIKAPEGVTILGHDEDPIVSCVGKMAAEAEPAEAEAAVESVAKATVSE